MSDDPSSTRRAGVSTSPRTAAMWAAVDEVVRARADELQRPLRVIDLGGGTGGLAVPLALAGHDVTVVDPSPDALASLRRRATEAQASSRVSAVQGDAETLASLVGRDRPDLVLCHGTLEYVDDPAATLAQVAAARPGARLLIVGDGPERPALEQRLGPFAHFAGYRKGEDLADHYAAADLFAFASKTETFGNVILEAMASHLPVISTPVSGIPEVIRDGDTGLTVPERDPVAIADAVERLIADPALAGEIAERAKVNGRVIIGDL